MLATLVGLAFCFGGTFLAIWTATTLGCRRLLGLNDSARDGMQPRLLLRGPYAHVRHPLLLASLLWLGAFAIVARDLRVAVVLALAGAWLIHRSRAHERELLESFGEAYRRYQESVPFLLPWS